MPRPPKRRRVAHVPRVNYFKPAGVPLYRLEEISLGLDELEALRLKDLAGLEQEACAREMGISQSTLQRVLTAARAKVTEALVFGRAIRIEGGPFAVREPRPCDPALPRLHSGGSGEGPPWVVEGYAPAWLQEKGRGRWRRVRRTEPVRNGKPRPGEHDDGPRGG